ncbi:MAG: alpha-E domain-containing protein [Ferrimicrobium sp.]|jgi:uncharacterized alpha-E superfamily protein|uniref:alpha-E domain-containing protein n=1 Tax=Ferrimicrobium sp. TaxID=2926050 RepID=UPI002635ECBB|nr:alpha-E domain-containing protein [Ferrimicrobium sp.]
MLVRIAESLFWLGRYLERADDTARILEVHLNHELESGSVSPRSAFLATLGFDDFSNGVDVDSGTLFATLGFSLEHPNSIASSIVAAHKNAGGLRELLPSEVYEAINISDRLLVKMPRNTRSLSEFFRYVRLAHERVAITVGLLTESFPRDEGWQFLQLGTFIERVDMTLRLLKFRLVFAPESQDWATTLKYCSAYEFYIRTYHGQVEPDCVLEFLLVDRLFPRSVQFGLLSAEHCLEQIAPETHRSAPPGPAQRALGQARATISFLTRQDLTTRIEALLEELSLSCSLASDAITQRYFGQTRSQLWQREAGGMTVSRDW